MEAGEKEQRKAFEEVTRRNVIAAIEHGEETRKMVRELQENVRRLQNIILNRERDLESLKIQVVKLLTERYSKGTVEND